MRLLTGCALAALMFAAATTSEAQPQSQQRQAQQQRLPSLFISPMGEAFHANASGARGIDLWFTEADTNYDGRIAQSEFLANADTFFARIDANHDGALTSLEDTAYWQRNAPQVVSDDASGDPVDAHAPTESGGSSTHSMTYDNLDTHRLGTQRVLGAQPYGLLGDIEPVMSCDTNFDRRVTLDEFNQCAERRFVQLDSNHDGFFTPDEVHFASGDLLRVSR